MPSAPAGTDSATPQIKCVTPFADPSLSDFLAGIADASTCHWGLDGASLWGADDVVLTDGGFIKAFEMRASEPGEQDRMAALASILGQTPRRLRSFARAVGDQATAFTLMFSGPWSGAARNLTVTVRNTVALYPNGTRAAYADRRGLLAPLTRKLAIQLRTCADNLRLDTAADVFNAVLGNSMSVPVSHAHPLEAALRSHQTSPLFGTLAQTGRTDGFNLVGNVDLFATDTSTRVINDTGTLDYNVSRGTVGLLGLDLIHPFATAKLYNPLARAVALDPPANCYWANATTLIQRLPLADIGNGIEATLTTAI